MSEVYEPHHRSIPDAYFLCNMYHMIARLRVAPTSLPKDIFVAINVIESRGIFL